MFDSPIARNAVTFLLRRGLTMIGSAGASVSEDWVTQTASLILIGLNELFQFWQSHKSAKRKADGEEYLVKVPQQP